MNKYSMLRTILTYMGFSAGVLVLALGVFVVVNHTKSLEHNLLDRMHIMTDDIIEHDLYTKSPQVLKKYFMSNKSYHKDSYVEYVRMIDFRYTKTPPEDSPSLSVIKKLPNGIFLVISSSSEYIKTQVKELLLRLGVGLLITLSLILLGLYLLLKKLLYPLMCLVDYCKNSSETNRIEVKCFGSYEVNALKDAIVGLEDSNHMLCKEKQNIFKEAAHEIKTPIAILKARLALFEKSEMDKDEFIEESKNDIYIISNKLRELIFLKAIEWDIQKSKEHVQMQEQCTMMQQLFRPILEKKNLKMISNSTSDFSIFIHKEAMGRVMQAVFENIFMHTKNGTTIETYIDSQTYTLSIVNERGKESDEVLFSSHIGTQIIERLTSKLEYKYITYEKDNLFYTKITFEGQNLETNI